MSRVRSHHPNLIERTGVIIFAISVLFVVIIVYLQSVVILDEADASRNGALSSLTVIKKSEMTIDDASSYFFHPRCIFIEDESLEHNILQTFPSRNSTIMHNRQIHQYPAEMSDVTQQFPYIDSMDSLMDEFLNEEDRIINEQQESIQKAFHKQQIRGPLLEKDLESSLCIPYHEWQKKSYPTCNIIHEVDFLSGIKAHANPNKFNKKKHVNDYSYLQSTMSFRNQGGGHDVWKYDYYFSDRYHSYKSKNKDEKTSKSKQKNKHNAENERYLKSTPCHKNTLAFKTLRWKRDFTEIEIEKTRIDSLAMERLTSSPYVINLYGYCSKTTLLGKKGVLIFNLFIIGVSFIFNSCVLSSIMFFLIDLPRVCNIWDNESTSQACNSS